MRRIVVVALAAIGLVGLGGPLTRAVACEEEGPGFVACRIAVTLADADLANVAGEVFDGTYALKGIVMRGTASCRDGDTEILSAPAKVDAVLLGTGDAETFLNNRAIVTLTYTFYDAAGTAVIGTGTGFVTLEEARRPWGTGAIQGTVAIEGSVRQFAGTGWSRARLIPQRPDLPPAPQTGLGDPTQLSYCEDGLSLLQELGEVVITGGKPGFAFEGAKTVRQLDRQYREKSKQLTRERNERRKVIRIVR